jgi:hypothetical protein
MEPPWHQFEGEPLELSDARFEQQAVLPGNVSRLSDPPTTLDNICIVLAQLGLGLQRGGGR